MIRKSLVAAFACAAALCFAVPASAEPFTSEDGVLSIELPSESWVEIEDPAKWIALSDGESVITIEHYSNGEKLPDMSVADEHYVDVYQAVFSTKNEVFIITGSVANEDKIPEVTQAIASTKVLKYDTKLAVTPAVEVKASEFTVVPADKTMYVTADGLNVRMGCSTDERIIGSYGYGASVKVTGVVQRNGSDLGWYQIAYENGTGYVSSAFLSDTAPSSKKESNSESKAESKDNTPEDQVNVEGDPYDNEHITVYDYDRNSYTLYKGSDGYWHEEDGTAYERRSDTTFQLKDGTKILTTYIDQDSEERDFYNTDSVTVYDDYGDYHVLYKSSDGLLRSEDGTAYEKISDSEFVREGTDEHFYA